MQMLAGDLGDMGDSLLQKQIIAGSHCLVCTAMALSRFKGGTCV